MKKRLLASILCLCLVVGLLPISAWAEEEPAAVHNIQVSDHLNQFGTLTVQESAETGAEVALDWSSEDGYAIVNFDLVNESTKEVISSTSSTKITMPDSDIVITGSVYKNDAEDQTTYFFPNEYGDFGKASCYLQTFKEKAVFADGTKRIRSQTFGKLWNPAYWQGWSSAGIFTELVFPEGLESIERDNFAIVWNDAKLKRDQVLVFPSTLKTIEDRAFARNQGNYLLNEGIESIGTSAFDSNKTNIIFVPNDAVQEKLNGKYAAAYSLVANLEGGTLAENTVIDYAAPGTLPSPIREGYVFAGWYTDPEYTESSKVDGAVQKVDGKFPTCYAKWMSDTGFCGAEDNEENVTWKLTANKEDPATYTLTISGTGAMASWEDKTRDTRPWAFASEQISSVVVENGVTNIGQNAFFALTALKEVTLGQNIETIERNAFRRCSSLTAFTIPDSVTSMGNNVLCECISIAQLNIGSGLTETGNSCLLDCGQGNLGPNTVLGKVVIPENIQRISGGSFRNCTNAVLLVKGAEVTADGNPNGVGSAKAVDATACTSFTFGGGNYGSAVVYVKNADVIHGLDGKSTSLKVAVTNGGTLAADEKFDGLAAPVKENSIFMGWYDNADCTGDKVTTPVAGQTYYAKWADCQHKNKTYTASGSVITETCTDCGHVFGTATLTLPENLVYDGQAKEATVAYEGWTGDKLAVIYTQDGEETTPVNAGAYTAEIAVGDVKVSLPMTITKATYDMSGVKFEDAAYTYDGQEKTLTISGTLPKGVTVSYENNTLTNAGDVTATAKFTGDSANYNAIPNMTATLTITKATPTVTITADKTALNGGGDVVLTVEKPRHSHGQVRQGECDRHREGRRVYCYPAQQQ